MLKRKAVRFALPFLLFSGLSLGNTQTTEALTRPENWHGATLVMGGGLTQSEIAQTKTLLGANVSEDSYNVEGADIERFLGTPGVNTSEMISSVSVERAGTGVQVDIVTPQNITGVSQEQYANAAITAGAENVVIKVASPRPVTGESALTGVYKAFSIHGEELEPDRMAVAQEELTLTTDIATDLDHTDAEKLNHVIVNVKTEITNYYQDHNQLADGARIAETVASELAAVQLDEVITEEQVSRLVTFFSNYQQTSAIDSKVILEQLNALGSRIGTTWQEAKDSGLLARISDAIGSFFHAVGSFFKSFGQEA